MALTRISELNRHLMTVIHTALALQMAQKIPVLAPGVTAPLETLRAEARIVASIQDGLLKADHGAKLTALRCGVPQENLRSLEEIIQRKPLPEATLAKTPSPLSWRGMTSALRPAWSHLRAFSGVTLYGQCSSEQHPRLLGESYGVSFRWRGGRLFWNPFSF